TPIEKQLGDILDNMLVVAVKKRYQSAGEVLRDLQPAVELRSAVGYDYTKLRDLLANQKWKAADEETAKAMFTVAGRDDFLRVEDIDHFPEDLRTIDRLWLKFSNGKFGFSVQKEIYQKLGGTMTFDPEKIWRKFGDTVGWRDNRRWLNKWKDYDELNWRRPLRDNTPGGHLPGLVRDLRNWMELKRYMALLSRRDL
ncbi:GUN4 domain-containing protein, partial [Geitlerinema sp. PCC 9228]|uniref:GUN4 domain-containing protein n=1 Tax=Geitlerinema sp. PCC 9228 TaxID=111611 RepID=UPI000A5552E6